MHMQTVSALGSFFLAMVLNPDVQRKAQRELDQVVGPHRLPDFSDQPSLRYVDAIVKETIIGGRILPALLRGGMNLCNPGRKSLNDW